MQALQFPIAVTSLQELLPHRPPMVWVSNVIHSDQETGICEVRLDPDSFAFSNGMLRQSSIVEWMAQAFGYSQACISKDVAAKVFLAALRDVIYPIQKDWQHAIQSIKKNDKAIVTTKIVKSLLPIILICAEVKLENNFVLGTASFKVFVEPKII